MYLPSLLFNDVILRAKARQRGITVDTFRVQEEQQRSEIIAALKKANREDSIKIMRKLADILPGATTADYDAFSIPRILLLRFLYRTIIGAL